MPNIEVKLNYTLALSHEEFRLLGLALASNSLKGADKQAALDLNAKMQDIRQQALSNYNEIMAGSASKARELADEHRQSLRKGDL